MKDENLHLSQKEDISFSEFLKGVPHNLNYEFNYLKGLDQEEHKEAMKSLTIGFATVIIGAIAILIPTFLQ